MKVLQFGEKLNTSVVLCLGYFETMHIGHRALLNVAKSQAEKSGAKLALFTFDRKTKEEIYTFDERMDLYKDVGVDFVVYADFTERFAATDGAKFVEKLFETCMLSAVVCGTDYTFGCDRCGTFELTRLVRGRCPLFVVKPVTIDGLKISSTQIRSLLKLGKLNEANALMQQPYFICGNVVHGRGVGKTLGFPTANIVVASNKILPTGVFCGKTEIDGVFYPVIVNIGGKPTFDISETTVEVHVVGYSGNLYNKKIKVQLAKYIRSIVKFDTEKQLVEQLQKDVLFAKSNFEDRR